mmetsp:Transcript_45199/g.89106  ORF Transcript_45199/g.89106 Transcript_45199/m.89106 type:complete len:246 (+) Transcript_45199:108-845(+)
MKKEGSGWLWYRVSAIALVESSSSIASSESGGSSQQQQQRNGSERGLPLPVVGGAQEKAEERRSCAWLSRGVTRMEKWFGPPEHRNKERLSFGLLVVMISFEFLTDVYVGGMMLGLSRQNGRGWLEVCGYWVCIFAVFDLLNFWLLRKDMRPANEQLIGWLALVLSLNEFVIFILTALVFQNYRETMMVLSMVPTFFGIVWKIVEFIWKRRRRGGSASSCCSPSLENSLEWCQNGWKHVLGFVGG